MAAKAGTAYVDVAGDFSTLNKQIGAAVAPLTSKFGKLGTAATVGLGGIAVGAVVAGKALYDIGVQFDQASDTITTKTGATGKELAKLEKQFKGVVKSTPTDFESAANAIGGLNQRLDLTGKPLRRLTRQMLELSRMTGTDLDENISTVARAFGDWEVATRKQGKTLDFFFRASQASGATVSELTSLIVKFGAPLRQFGFTVEEATSMFALFEKSGVNIQTMVPGLKLALSEFLEAGRDPQRALQKTFEGIADGSIEAADAIKIFGKRAGADMVEAIGQGRFSFEKFTKAIADGDATILGTSKRTRDFSENWEIFSNNLKTALEPLATKVFDRLGKSMSKVLDILSDKNLSRTEKFDRIAGMITDALSEGFTKAADLAGRMAPKVAVAFVKGFANAGIWGQLAAGTFLIAKLGKGSGMAALGRKMGSKFGLAFLAGVLGVELGKQIHKIVVGEKLGSGPREEFAAELEGFGLEVKNFVGKNKVRVATAFGDLIFNARTKQVVKARGRLISKLVGDIPGQAIPKLLQLERSSHNIFEDTSTHAVKKSRDMRKGVVRNVNWLDSGVQTGLVSIVANLNQALKNLGVKKLVASIAGNLPSSAQDIQGLQQQGQRGLVVRGSGFGDKVRALLEPGEVVINRKAVQAMGGPQRVNQINQIVPRFAQGGIAEPMISGTSPMLRGMGQNALHRAAVGARAYLKKHRGLGGGSASWKAIDKFARSFGLGINNSYRKGDFDSFHGQLLNDGSGRAHATDYTPAGSGAYKFANRLGKRMGSKLRELIYSPLGWSIDDGQKVPPYAVADHFDHVHVAFQGGGVVPAWVHGSGTLSANQLASLAKYVHSKHPGLMSQIAQAESGGSPTAMGGAGDKGLWQIIPSTASGFGINYSGLFDPLNNARGMKKILDGQGLGAWSTYNSGAYRSETKGVPGPLGGAGGAIGAVGGKPKLKLTKKQQKAIRRLTKHLAGLGLHKATQANINTKTAKYLQLEEYAGYASELGAAFRGRDELSYLTEELQVLFRLRNLLVNVFATLAAQRDEITKQLTTATRRLGGLEKVKNPSKGQRLEMKALRRRIPLLTTTQKKLNSQIGGIVGDEGLVAIQGTGGSMKGLDAMTASVAASKFGGQIFSVANSILGLGADASVTGEGDSGLLEVQKELNRTLAQENLILRAQMPVFKDLASFPPFAGTFHDGGVVAGPKGAERMALVKAGERISDDEAGGTYLLVEDGAVDPDKIRRISREEYEARERRARNVARNSLGRRR